MDLAYLGVIAGPPPLSDAAFRRPARKLHEADLRPLASVLPAPARTDVGDVKGVEDRVMFMRNVHRRGRGEAALS